MPEPKPASDESLPQSEQRLAAEKQLTVEEQLELTRQQVAALKRVSQSLDGTGIAQYVRLMQSMPRVLWINFLSGIARGLGFTVGTAIVLAFAYQIISHIIVLNIPYLTDVLQELIRIVQGGGVE